MVLPEADREALERYFAEWSAWLRLVVDERRLGRNKSPGWKHDMPAPPIDAAMSGALNHPNPKVRRECLNILDHHASDDSVDVFRAALHDPVPRVREVALHGLSCERCRTTELCVSDVVADLVQSLASDPSAKVRHAVVLMLSRLMGRDARAGEALARAATDDVDDLVRQAAAAAADGRRRDVRTRKAMRRRAKNAVAVSAG